MKGLLENITLSQTPNSIEENNLTVVPVPIVFSIHSAVFFRATESS